MKKHHLLHEALTRSVIGAFFEVYDHLGYRYPERFYKAALERELQLRGHVVEREVLVEVRYKGILLGMKRLDMLVDHVLVLEVKSGHEMHHTFRKQLVLYLDATRFELGLVLNFGPKAQFERVILSRDHRAPEGGIRPRGPRHRRSPRPPVGKERQIEEADIDGAVEDEM